MINIILSLYCIVLFFVAYKFDVSENKVLFIFSFPSFLIAAFYPIHYDYGLGNVFMVNSVSNFTDISWFWVLVIITSYPLSFMVSSFFLSKIKRNNTSKFLISSINMSKVSILFYAFSFISILALIINLSHVYNSFYLLFAGSREYEKLFGKYWFVNYLYFLHIPAIILFCLKKEFNKLRFVDFIILIVLVIGSTLHGIKYTFFDCIFIPLLFYIVIKGFNKLKIPFVILTLSFILFSSFYTLFVRGIGEDADYLYFLKYVIPNYYNLFYTLENNPFPQGLPTNLIFSFFDFGLDQSLLPSGFLLNDQYNMSTGFRYLINSFSIFGVLIYYSLMSFLFNYISSSNIIKVYVKSFILFTYLMMFYSYYIGTKPKYIYLGVIVVFLFYVTKNKYCTLNQRG